MLKFQECYRNVSLSPTSRTVSPQDVARHLPLPQVSLVFLPMDPFGGGAWHMDVWMYTLAKTVILLAESSSNIVESKNNEALGHSG